MSAEQKASQKPDNQGDSKEPLTPDSAIVRAVRAKASWPRRMLSPWVQRALQTLTPAGTRPALPRQRLPIPLTTPNTGRLVQRVRHTANRSAVLQPKIKAHPAQRISRAIVSRFPEPGARYTVRPLNIAAVEADLTLAGVQPQETAPEPETVVQEDFESMLSRAVSFESMMDRINKPRAEQAQTKSTPAPTEEPSAPPRSTSDFESIISRVQKARQTSTGPTPTPPTPPQPQPPAKIQRQPGRPMPPRARPFSKIEEITPSGQAGPPKPPAAEVPPPKPEPRPAEPPPAPTEPDSPKDSPKAEAEKPVQRQPETAPPEPPAVGAPEPEPPAEAADAPEKVDTPEEPKAEPPPQMILRKPQEATAPPQTEAETEPQTEPPPAAVDTPKPDARQKPAPPEPDSPQDSPKTGPEPPVQRKQDTAPPEPEPPAEAADAPERVDTPEEPKEESPPQMILRKPQEATAPPQTEAETEPQTEPPPAAVDTPKPDARQKPAPPESAPGQRRAEPPQPAEQIEPPLPERQPTGVAGPEIESPEIALESAAGADEPAEEAPPEQEILPPQADVDTPKHPPVEPGPVRKPDTSPTSEPDLPLREPPAGPEPPQEQREPPARESTQLPAGRQERVTPPEPAPSDTGSPVVQRRAAEHAEPEMPLRAQPPAQPQPEAEEPPAADKAVDDLSQDIVAKGASGARVPLITPRPTPARRRPQSRVAVLPQAQRPAGPVQPARDRAAPEAAGQPMARRQTRPAAQETAPDHTLPLVLPRPGKAAKSERAADGGLVGPDVDAPASGAPVQRMPAEPAVAPAETGGVSGIIQRVEEAPAEPTTPPAEEETAPNLDRLARQVYPLIKRMLAVERERRPRY